MLGAIPLAQRARLGRLAKFGLVGLSGILVNLVVQAALIELLHMNYVVAAILSTQVSSTWNFLGAEVWVFGSGAATTSRLGRYAAFMAMSNAALILRVPFMWVLTSVLGVFYTLSNLASLALMTLGRFLLSDGLIWKTAPETAAADAVMGANVAAAMTVAPPPPATPYRGLHVGPEEIGDPEPVSVPAGDLPEPDRVHLEPDQVHLERWLIAGCVLVGTLLRVWQLSAVGLNSDEAVYAGQAAAIAGDHSLTPFFPVIRAHPLLFQGLLSIVYHLGTSPLVGRLASVLFGVGTIVLAYLTAKLLYGARAGLFAALIVALMPYQVIVDRQILLDVPTAFFATLALYLLARYAMDQRLGWLVASAGTVGLAVLSKETSVVLVASMFAFVALSPEIRIRVRDAVIAIAVFVAVVVPWPLVVVLAGKSHTGSSYLTWQLFRRPNHTIGFYATTIPAYLGPVVLLLAAIALVMRWRAGTWSWREWLLLSWSVVPFLFFQLWPVKGFQYLLGASIPVALLAAVGTAEIIAWFQSDETFARGRVGSRVGALIIGLIVVSLIVPAWKDTQTPPGDSMLAGTGGVAGGREAGAWISKNTPDGAEVVTIGPSMANLIQFYGHRQRVRVVGEPQRPRSEPELPTAVATLIWPCAPVRCSTSSGTPTRVPGRRSSATASRRTCSATTDGSCSPTTPVASPG